MYSYEDRLRAIKLYIKYDYREAEAILVLGYPSRKMLKYWYQQYIETGVIQKNFHKKEKYSIEQKKKAVNYYLDHGRCISQTIRVIGYPSRPIMRLWIDELLPGKRRVFVRSENNIIYSQEQKKEAVIELCSRETSADKVADIYGVSRVSLYKWKHQLLPQEENKILDKNNLESLPNVAGALSEEIDSLKKQIHRLQLERDILEKANELLKKDLGINLQRLTNKERTLLIDALRNTYSLAELLKQLRIPKSSYFYHNKRLMRPEKYTDLRKLVKEIFHENKSRYGYRRIHMVVDRTGKQVSEKVIRRLMTEEQLKVHSKRSKKYSSYKGEVSPAVENVIKRDFKAASPNIKWLTDITEFRLPAGKVYLSPIIDCYDGLVVSWTIGMTPNSEMVTSMLDAAILSLAEGERPIVHSDRGAHYRWPGWISRMTDAQLTRSMSKKGCSPDNAACEGFFGRLKNEMFYNRSWNEITIEGFIDELDCYIRWYNEKRIKISLGALSPIEYRKSLGLLA